MSVLIESIALAKKEGKSLFYNSSGSKQAYQLGVKHLSAAEFLGFASALPNGDLRVIKTFLLVDFETKKIVQIPKGTRISPVKLENA